MRASLAFAVLLALLAGFSFATQTVPVAGARGGPPPQRTWRSLCAGKPAARIGELAGLVVERPEGDEAVVRGDWSRGPFGEGCRLELVLPEGATLLEGETGFDLPEGVQAGSATWRVRFPRQCTSDLTLRLCASLEGQSVSKEAYVRLWECE